MCVNQLYILPLLLLLSIQCDAQSTDTRLIGLDAQIDSLMQAYHAVGLSIAIVENNKVVYTKGFGFRDLKKKLPVTPNTLFGIGSVTKQFTASLIGKYQSEGKLSFDDRPSRHLPKLKFYTAEMDERISIHELLTHTSGIGGVDGNHVFFPTKNIDQHLARLPYLIPNGTADRQVNYCNMGYAILGEIGSQVTGKSWAENIKDDLLRPLGMNTSNTAMQARLHSPNYALAYSVLNGEAVEVLPEDQHENSAAGAINSSAEDMSKWLRMLLNKGSYQGRQILPSEFLETAWTAHTSFPAFTFGDTSILEFNMAGYGWFIQNFRNYYKVNHSGGTSGFAANLDLYPNENLGIVVLTNQQNTDIVYNVSDLITIRMLELEPLVWSDFNIRYMEARTFGASHTPIDQENKPSLPLESYTGMYENKGYGKLEVSIVNGNLAVSLPAFELMLSHQGGEIFRSQPIHETHQNNPSFFYTFLPTENGGVSGLSVNMQRDHVQFEKIK